MFSGKKGVSLEVFRKRRGVSFKVFNIQRGAFLKFSARQGVSPYNLETGEFH